MNDDELNINPPGTIIEDPRPSPGWRTQILLTMKLLGNPCQDTAFSYLVA
jgi:hypothetical protein